MRKPWQWLRWFWCRGALKRLEQRVIDDLAAGDCHAAIAGLERQLQNYDWPFQAESLLFKRKTRPQDPIVALDLLEAMQASCVLRSHHCFYAGIAAAYSALALEQESRLPRLAGWLHQQACLQGVASARLVDRARNRQNTYKQLISARACLLQFAIAEQDQQLAEAIAEANLAVLKGLDLEQLPADVVYRSLTNLQRGLLPLSTTQSGCERLLPLFSGLLKEMQRRRYRQPRRRAQENHLAMLQLGNQCLLEALEGDTPEQRQQRLQLMVNTPSALVQQGLNQWLDTFSDCASVIASREG